MSHIVILVVEFRRTTLFDFVFDCYKLLLLFLFVFFTLPRIKTWAFMKDDS